MAVPAEIQPFAALAKLGERQSGAAKFGLKIQVPELSFNLDEQKIGLMVAQGIQETLRENLSSGRQPDGSPMPQASTATITRREYRRKQWERGAEQLRLTRKGLGEFLAGEVNAPDVARRAGRSTRVLKSADVSRADRREIRRRFKSAGVKGSGPQGTFQPTNPSTFGLESGLMAASVRIRYTAPKTFDVFFSDKRGSFASPRDGKTAVQRVFERIPIWSRQAMQQPRLAEVMKRVPTLVVRHRASAALTQALLKGLETAGRLAVEQLDTDVVD